MSKQISHQQGGNNDGRATPVQNSFVDNSNFQREKSFEKKNKTTTRNTLVWFIYELLLTSLS